MLVVDHLRHVFCVCPSGMDEDGRVRRGEAVCPVIRLSRGQLRVIAEMAVEVSTTVQQLVLALLLTAGVIFAVNKLFYSAQRASEGGSKKKKKKKKAANGVDSAGAKSVPESSSGEITQDERGMLSNKLKTRERILAQYAEENKRLKQALADSSELLTRTEQRLNNDMQRLKQKCQERLEQAKAAAQTQIAHARRQASPSPALSIPSPVVDKSEQMASLKQEHHEETMLLRRRLTQLNADFETARATQTKLKNDNSKLSQDLISRVRERDLYMGECEHLKERVEGMASALNKTQTRASELDALVTKLTARKEELKCSNRVLVEHLEVVEKSVLELSEENRKLSKEQPSKKISTTTVMKSEPLPMGSTKSLPSGTGSKNKLASMLQTKGGFVDAAAQVALADETTVDYILSVVLSELGEADFSGDLDRQVMDALFALVPSLQHKSRKEQKLVKKVLLDWARSMAPVVQTQATEKTAQPSQYRGSVPPGFERPPSRSPPPGFEDETKPTVQMHVVNTEEREGLTVLKRLFPEISNLTQILILCNGDLDLAASSILEELESDTEHLKIWYINDNPNHLAEETEEIRKKREKNLKQRMLQRYFMRLEQTKKCHPTLAGRLKASSDGKIRYRGDRVVSTTGERFTIVKKETKEQIDATSVSLAWVKRKRKGGSQTAPFNQGKK